MKFLNKPINYDLVAKWIVRLIIILGAIIILKSLFNDYMETREVYKDREYTFGIILEYSLVPRSGTHSIEYKYYVNNKEYTNTNGIDRLKCKKCLGLKYKVIYSKKNPGKSYLLATEKMFKRFDIEIPKKMEISD